MVDPVDRVGPGGLLGEMRGVNRQVAPGGFQRLAARLGMFFALHSRARNEPVPPVDAPMAMMRSVVRNTRLPVDAGNTASAL